MKYIYLSIAVVLLGSSAALWVALSGENPTTAIFIRKDITDPLATCPHWEAIRKRFDLTTDLWNGRICSYANISEFRTTQAEINTLLPAHQIVGNEGERRNAVRTFLVWFDTLADTSATQTIGKEQSSVYIPLAKSLESLATLHATTKELWLYSDLMENAHGLSFYDPNTFQKVKSNPSAIAALLEKEHPLRSLTGITVNIFYTPTTKEADDHFAATSKLYKALLEAKGATVHINPSITAQ